MARNASGTYSLPAGNPVISGTTITTTWANTTMDDIATGLTNSLDRGGRGAMTAKLQLFDGTVTVPGLTFGSEPTTGLYRASSGNMRITLLGSDVVTVTAAGVAITGSLTLSTDLAIAHGGTGASTAADAFTALKQAATLTATGVVEQSTSAENVTGTSDTVFPSVLGTKEIVDTHGGNAQTANPLSQFAATTSLQLLGVISDETGTGALVFGTNPTLTGATLAGTLAGADNTVSRVNLLDYGEITNAIGSTGGGTQDIDLALGNSVTATVDTSTNTFTFSNPTASDERSGFTLTLTNGGSQTVNWPASVDWPEGAAPELTASGRDVLVFETVDGGTIWYGNLVGVAYA